MRERPALTDSQIAAALREGYGLSTDRVTFLPVGNDSGAWSYRIDAGDGRTYFLKVRRGEPDAPGLVVPCYLREQGMIEVVAALPAT